jgi:hypothetical protein
MIGLYKVCLRRGSICGEGGSNRSSNPSQVFPTATAGSMNGAPTKSMGLKLVMVLGCFYSDGTVLLSLFSISHCSSRVTDIARRLGLPNPLNRRKLLLPGGCALFSAVS